MLQIISTPASNHHSRWSALFNPIVFEYQLFDSYAITAVYSPGTNQLALTVDTAINTLNNGQLITVKTSNYNFTLPLANFDTDFAGQTTFYFNTPVTGTNVDGYLSMAIDRKKIGSYRLRTEITWGYDGAANVFTADHTPNSSGYCRADISKYLRSLLQPKDDFDYSVINYRDANISASYTVRVAEVVNGVQGAWASAGDPFYVTYSAMQIGNQTGGNMSPYVTLHTAGQTSPAKFLNDFAIPRYYTDMPFDLSFIYSEQIVGYPIKLGGTGIDVNGNSTGALGAAYLLNENGSVLLNQDGSKLLIASAGPLTLYSKLGVNRLTFNQGVPAGSTYVDVFLFYTDSNGNNIRVTESKRMLLDSSPCNGLPYEYLKWMGPSGGWLYYMLIKNQIHELGTSGAVTTDLYIADYALADSSTQLISIAAQKKITAGKNDVAAAEMEVLATLLYSPKVYRLVDAATNTWQGVIVDTKSLKMYQTYAGVGDFEIAYLLPGVNVQSA